MKVIILGSGSKGNSTYINVEDDHILIDAGFSYLDLSKRLKVHNIDIKKINKVFITHDHSDHIKGLKTLVNKVKPTVYAPSIITSILTDIIDAKYLSIINDYENFNTFELNLIPTSHDAEGSVGYLIKHNKKELVLITDTGYINRKILNKIKGKDMYIIESNYDEKLLWDGPYPYFLKQRITSDTGHLSNIMTSEYLVKLINKDTKYVVLAHLSDTNNDSEIAFNTTNDELIANNLTHVDLSVALQDIPSKIFNLGESND